MPDILLFGLSLALAVLALAALAAWALVGWKDAEAEALSLKEAYDYVLSEASDDRRKLVRLALANPGRSAEAKRLADSLIAVPVIRAGVIAAVVEMQRTAAADMAVDPAALAKEAIGLAVEGDVNVFALVRAVIQAVDRAAIDLDLEAAAVRAGLALEGGESAPIEDVLDRLRDPTNSVTIRRIPIRTLGDVVKDARRGSDGRDRLNPGN